MLGRNHTIYRDEKLTRRGMPVRLEAVTAVTAVTAVGRHVRLEAVTAVMGWGVMFDSRRLRGHQQAKRRRRP